MLGNGELDLGDIDVILAARSLSTQHDRRDGPDTRYHFDADDAETLARSGPRTGIVNARTMGKNAAVASAGASSVNV